MNMVPRILCAFFFVYLVKSDGCITQIYLYGQTSGLSGAGSNSDTMVLTFDYLLNGDKKSITYELYNLPGEDMDKNKGSLWSFDAPAGCLTVDGFRSMVISENSRDGWNIASAMTYGVYDDDIPGQLFLFTHDYSIYGWVDSSLTPPQDTVSLTEDYVQRDNCKAAQECISRILITAYTGGDKNDGSDGNNYFKLTHGSTYTQVMLYDRPGDDMHKNQGDLWDYEATDFGLVGCVTFGSISGASFVSGTNDGWEISDAFVTVELDQSGYFALLAGNKNLYKWLDGSGVVPLTMRNKCSSAQGTLEI